MNRREKMTHCHKQAKEKLESGDYVLIPTSISQADFQYMIEIFQLMQTIMYYEKNYISKETGLRGLPTIWDYLCATKDSNRNSGKYNDEYYDEIVTHRKNLGFPVDDLGFPKMNSRTFQRFIAGEKVKNGMEILEEFYQNKNFLEIYWKSREEFSSIENIPSIENILSYPKVVNKMEQMFETFERTAFSKHSGKKFRSKAEFVGWRFDNLEEYKDILSSKKFN
ncbi:MULTISPECIES: hypothetical protein [Streptococcus]|uniref:hypothetical protein n=1 Tax=Streptococcus TaxID=1301 RepID=UPI0002250E62|nr:MULTISPECIES: hypothetical protein [Streptococcus]EGX30463.1 hypothetical protein SSALIVM18_07291 [Streptococcus salivarius M18]MBZ5847176.1 hypothetical protein [Streptococcus salivarius]MDB8627187.1 hypothetical protein [Streptococcus parasanguinis]